MITQACRKCALELDALPSRIPGIRRIVSAQLRYWHLDSLATTALLGITELLTNVHRHARPDKHCKVDMSFSNGWLTICVADNDPRLPQVRSLEPLSPGGRGLALIAALCDSWGTEALESGGKVVWFTLRAEAPVPSPLPVEHESGREPASRRAHREPRLRLEPEPRREPERQHEPEPRQEPERQHERVPVPVASCV